MPVQRPRDWKRERDAELSAHLEESGHILVETNTCSLCSIGIGPNHVEQQLYLYPIYQKSMWDKDDNWVYVESKWVFCCGDCARHKRRNLSDDLLLVDYREQRPEKEEGDFTVDQRIEALLLLWTFYIRHIPVRLLSFSTYFPAIPTQEAIMPHRPFMSRTGIPYPTALQKKKTLQGACAL